LRGECLNRCWRGAHLEFDRLQKSRAQSTSTLVLEFWELSLTDPS